RTKGMSDEEAAKAAHAAIEGLLRGVGMPLRLGEAGVPREACDVIAADAMTDFFLFRNARKIRDAGELAEVLRGAY
ncbi:MAG: iron-containing alcohol dehydrogenase, partial [Chloroflexota bacterium]